MKVINCPNNDLAILNDNNEAKIIINTDGVAKTAFFQEEVEDNEYITKSFADAHYLDGKVYTAGNGINIDSANTVSIDEEVTATKTFVNDGLATKQDTLTAGTGIAIADNTVGVTDEIATKTFVNDGLATKQNTLTAGVGISIADNTIGINETVVATKTDLTAKQDVLTAGAGIDITTNTVSVKTANTSDIGGIKLANKVSTDNDAVQCDAIADADYATADGKSFISKATLDTQLAKKVPQKLLSEAVVVEEGQTEVGIYAKDFDGNEKLYTASNYNRPSTLVYRTSDGGIKCTTPEAVNSEDVANVGYVKSQKGFTLTLQTAATAGEIYIVDAEGVVSGITEAKDYKNVVAVGLTVNTYIIGGGDSFAYFSAGTDGKIQLGGSTVVDASTANHSIKVLLTNCTINAGI